MLSRLAAARPFGYSPVLSATTHAWTSSVVPRMDTTSDGDGASAALGYPNQSTVTVPVDSGWGGGSSTQEDVSELFTFLVILLRCPALPLSEALFHGGQSESGDSRVSTERALYLALPEEEEGGECLELGLVCRAVIRTGWRERLVFDDGCSRVFLVSNGCVHAGRLVCGCVSHGIMGVAIRGKRALS